MWWDLEFWNRSVVRAAGRPGEFEWTPSTFPKLDLRFDPTTGRANISPTRYAAQSDKETRFRISGTAVSDTRGAIVTDAEQPWRTDWLTFGLTDDGWSRPNVPVTIRVFPRTGQRHGEIRQLVVGVRAPDDVASRTYEFRTDLEHEGGVATNGATGFRFMNVCVPPRGHTDVRITTNDHSPVYGDMRNQDSINEFRDGGILFVQIALSDDVAGPCRP
jgi:hypothetical protein